MGLSSEDRSVFNDYARNLRAFPSLIAVADHLAACESLLREIGEVSSYFTDGDGYQVALSDPQILLDWQFRITELLGPAP